MHVFSDLIDIDTVQGLSESFYRATGILSTVIGLDGTILIQSGREEICADFHRANPQTCDCCRESDTALATALREGAATAVFECRNGLIDAAAPITVDGEHIADLVLGPFRKKQRDVDWFRERAREIGFDEASYLHALAKVQVIPDERIEPLLKYLSSLAAFIGEMGLRQIKLRKALDSIKTLKGLLPICSNCKKIRDDTGYWNQIEAYIKDHSEADFTHSLCPECVKKLYPDL